MANNLFGLKNYRINTNKINLLKINYYTGNMPIERGYSNYNEISANCYKSQFVDIRNKTL